VVKSEEEEKHNFKRESNPPSRKQYWTLKCSKYIYSQNKNKAHTFECVAKE